MLRWLGYLVEERRREIGIRLALGARRADVVRLLFSSAGRGLAGGVALGLLGAPLAATTLDRYIRDLSPVDPASYAAVVLILAGAAAVATVGPARRALTVDPAVTLRTE